MHHCYLLHYITIIKAVKTNQEVAFCSAGFISILHDFVFRGGLQETGKRQNLFLQNNSVDFQQRHERQTSQRMETEWSRSSSAPVVSTCSHPTALLQRFHRITQKRYVRVTQFISLSSPFICSHRCTTGGSISSRAFITSEERAPPVASRRAVLQPCSPRAGQQLHMWLMIIIVWQAGSSGHCCSWDAFVRAFVFAFYKICNQIWA